MEGKKIIGNDKEYRKAPGFNNSLLNDYSQGLTALRTYLNIGLTKAEIEEKQNKPHFRKGSATDVWLTQSEEDFRKQFVIVPDFNEESQEGILLKAWIASGRTDWKPEEMEEFSRTVVYKDPKTKKLKVGLWGNIKNPELRIAKFDSPFLKNRIFPYLRSFNGMTHLSQAEYEDVASGVKKLQENEFTSRLMTPSENEILYTQLMIFEEIEFSELKGKITRDIPGVRVDSEGRVWITFKGLLDFVTVDTKKETVTPRDLKTSGKPIGENFFSSFLDYGYVSQASMYTFLIERWAAKNYPGYKIEPFQFVVASITEKDEPSMIFQLLDDHLAIAKHGGTLMFSDNGKVKRKNFQGWIKLAKNLALQHETGQLYTTPDQKAKVDSGEPIIPDFKCFSLTQEVVKSSSEFDNSNFDDLGLIDS